MYYFAHIQGFTFVSKNGCPFGQPIPTRGCPIKKMVARHHKCKEISKEKWLSCWATRVQLLVARQVKWLPRKTGYMKPCYR